MKDNILSISEKYKEFIMKTKEMEMQTGLSRHTLRYYEKIGLLQHIRRDANGLREYTEDDVAWTGFLMLMKETRMSLEDLKIYSNSHYEENPDVTERLKVLKRHKETILKELECLNNTLDLINRKINYYDDGNNNHDNC